MSGWFTSFLNCRLCRDGELVEGEHFVVSDDTGLILESTGYIGGDAVDLEEGIIAPGFLELQTNGMRGFHFTNLKDVTTYTQQMNEVCRYLPSTGVTGFYPTIPTVARDKFIKILPLLRPRQVPEGASILGAHAEGPYLHSSKKGAHNADHFQNPETPPFNVYGDIAHDNATLKIVTLAPELPNVCSLIQDLSRRGIRVSLGHSSASFEQGRQAVEAGASCLTHTLNAMAPLRHRDPGLAGLLTAAPAVLPSTPYYSIITDGNHLHPSVATMLFRANPAKCILVTDSIELAGLPDGTYPGHSQVPHNQFKTGTRTVIEGTDTLVGSCATMQECLQNLMKWSGCTVAQAVRCVTENVAELMAESTRGRLEPGRRADFVILDDHGTVLQTWTAGKKVWDHKDA